MCEEEWLGLPGDPGGWRIALMCGGARGTDPRPGSPWLQGSGSLASQREARREREGEGDGDELRVRMWD